MLLSAMYLDVYSIYNTFNFKYNILEIIYY